MNDTYAPPRDPSKRPSQQNLVVPEDHGGGKTLDVPPILGVGMLSGQTGLITGEPVPVGLRKGSGWSSGAGAFSDTQSLLTNFKQWENDPIGTGLKTYGVYDSFSSLKGPPEQRDPVGILVDAGVGWLVDHLEPMPTHLDIVAGDPDGMKAVSASWGKIAHEIKSLGTDLGGHSKQDLLGLNAKALTAYEWVVTSKVAAIGALGKVCDAAATMASALADAAESLRNAVRGIYVEACKAIVKFVLYRFGFFKPNLVNEVKGLIISGAKIVNELLNHFRSRIQKARQLLDALSAQAGNISTYLNREAAA